MNLKSQKYIFIIILAIIALGSFNYALFYYLGVDNNRVIQFANLFLVFIIVFLTILGFKQTRKAPIQFLFLLLPVSWGIINSLLRLNIVELLPTAVRFLLYILIGVFSYNLNLKYGNYEKLISIVIKYLKIQSLLIIIFSSLEILLGDLEFMNGVYRVTGGFKGHALAQALFLFVIIVLYFELIISKISLRNIKDYYKLVVFILLLYFFFRSGSRLLLVDLVFVYILYFIIRIKSLKIFFKIGISTLLFTYFFYIVILNTEISPRLKWLITSETSFYDEGSNKTRLLIVEKSIEGLNQNDFIFGIGLGGFNKFYEGISGKKNHAAHNNYLQFLAETGILGLLSFLMFQSMIFFRLVHLIRKRQTKIYRIAFILFTGIDIVAFLNNNYYFPFSEIIVWIFLGIALRYDTYDEFDLKKRPVNVLI